MIFNVEFEFILDILNIVFNMMGFIFVLMVVFVLFVGYKV